MTESDYARFVLTPPNAEQLRDKADQERKAAKENGLKSCMRSVVLGFGIRTTCELPEGHRGPCR